MAAVRISERIRGNSLNAKSYLNGFPKSTRADLTFLKFDQPRKNSTGISDLMHQMQRSPNNYIQKSPASTHDLVAELKIKNEKIRLFYQAQMANIQNSQEQLKIENISLSNANQNLQSQLRDARFIIQRLYSELDIEEHQNQPIDSILEQKDQFIRHMMNCQQIYLSRMENQQQKLTKLTQKINKMRKQPVDITSSMRQLDPQTIITEIKQEKAKLISQLKMVDTKLKTEQQANKRYQTLEEQYNEFKKKHILLVSQLTQEKNKAMQQEATLKNEAQEKINLLETQLNELMNDIEKKTSNIEQLKKQLMESDKFVKQSKEQLNQLLAKEQSDQQKLENLNRQLKQQQQQQITEKLQMQHQDQVVMLTSNLNAKEEQNRSLKKELFEQNRFNSQQLEVIEKQKKEINSIQQQLEQSLKEKAKIQQQFEICKNENSVLLQKQEDLKLLQQRINKQNETIQNLVAQNKNYEDRLKEYESKQQQMQGEIKKLNEQLETQINQKQELFKKNQELNVDKENLQEQILQQKTRLLEKNNELQQQIALLKQELQGYEKDLNQYKLIKDQLDDHLQEALKHVDDLQQKLNDEQQQTQQLLKQLSSLSENKSSIQNQDILDLFDDVKQTENVSLPNQSDLQQIRNLQSQIEQQTVTIGEQEQIIDQLNYEMNILNQTLVDTTNNVTTLEQTIQKLILEKEQALKEQTSSGEETKHLQQKTSSQQMLIQNLQKQVTDLQNQLTESQEKNIQLQQDIAQKLVNTSQEETLKKLLNEKDTTISQLQEELRSIHEQIEQKLNKSLLSNRSKRSLQQVKFEQFADLDADEENQASDDDDDLLFEKLMLEKQVKELKEKITLLESQTPSTGNCTKCIQFEQQYKTQLEKSQDFEKQLQHISEESVLSKDQMLTQIQQKDTEISNLKEELRKIHEQIELQMNKSVVSNRSKRSQNQINFDQFADLGEDSNGSGEDDEDLEKIVQSNRNQKNLLEFD